MQKARADKAGEIDLTCCGILVGVGAFKTCEGLKKRKKDLTRKLQREKSFLPLHSQNERGLRKPEGLSKRD